MKMSGQQIPAIENRAELMAETVALVRQWMSDAESAPASAASERLSGLLQDENGLEFAVGFIDGVIRPEDKMVAGVNLFRLRNLIPSFLPLPLRLLLLVGCYFAPVLPWIVIPIARLVLRIFVSHLVVDATPDKLTKTLAELKASGVALNVNLLGEAVLGRQEADRRLQKTMDLLSRDDVDYVSIKVSSTIAPHSKWAFEQNVSAVIERLRPLFRLASTSSSPKFINLDMEEYHDLDLTVAVFKGVLGQPEFKLLEAGIVLQAYLPDALGAMIDLQDWAAQRVAQGGAAIKVRVVKGANLPMERVDSEIHGWPLATVRSKAEADANYKRVINYALTPERIKNLRIGVAGHNLFDLAFAWRLAAARGAQSGLDFEMLLGMAQAQAEAVQKTVGRLVLYTPVVHPAEFDVAIAYLIRRLEEGASPENFLSGAFELNDPEVFDRELKRFESSLNLVDSTIPTPNRVQDRLNDQVAKRGMVFENAPDTDPAIEANREWARQIQARVAKSRLGIEQLKSQTLKTQKAMDVTLAHAHAAGVRWGEKPGFQRAALIDELGLLIEANRAQLIEVSMAEAGKTLDQADTEISEAVDFAYYYADRARELDTVDGAIQKPIPLTVVTPPWNFPVAIPAGSALAALAAGSAVVFKPAGLAARTGALLADLFLQVFNDGQFAAIQIEESDLGQQLLSDPRVGQVILTGGFETAELFREFNPELRLLAETSGKNSMIITPSADLDLAAKDLAYSAFGHAGQKCSAASLVILVGSVARSKRFERQLVDAVESMHVAHPTDALAQIGPLITAPESKLLNGLTDLQPGEQWLLQPRQLDESGRLWSPGIKTGVKAGSESHMVEYFGPVLAIMTAQTLGQAIKLQNAVEYGLTAGIHSLNPNEVRRWVDQVQAGNLYVNRGITGAIVQRQPFGGWKRSAIGPGAKAGGPNYVMSLTGWDVARSGSLGQATSSMMNRLLGLATVAGLTSATINSLRRAAESDMTALDRSFDRLTDVSDLQLERNIFRYRRSDCELRIPAGAAEFDSWRCLMAVSSLGNVRVSAAPNVVPQSVIEALTENSVTVVVEQDDEWLESLRERPRRVRLAGLCPALEGASPLSNPEVTIYDQPATESGHLELLPYFKEQAISITAHRFGNPSRLAQSVLTIQ
jgi:RHH-type proline utilization regulon transcriptional repressor/proline dehydrogenase/delta 1-pyrroline-5-carboxylate dehydrogenase